MRLQKDLREFIELFNSNGVEYLIVGGFALAFHGRPRYTGDIDLLVVPSKENSGRIVTALREFGFRVTGLRAGDFTEADQVIQLGRPPNRIDLLTSVSGVTAADAWAQRIAGELDGLPVFFLSRDHLIANKRATGRLQDKADLEALGEDPE